MSNLAGEVTHQSSLGFASPYSERQRTALIVLAQNPIGRGGRHRHSLTAARSASRLRKHSAIGS